jgi:hypothetical protein
MSSPDTRAILERIGRPLYKVPCLITQVTPLMVTINETSMPGLKVSGATYDVGPAIALVESPGLPLVIPTLPIGS